MPPLLDQFGNEIQSSQAVAAEEKAVSVPYNNGGWYSLTREPFPGAWQRNMEINRETLLTFHTVWSCLTLISGDISKLRIKLVQRDPKNFDVWEEIDNPAYSPVLRKPNLYQTHNLFLEAWILSKLIRGNTFVLKERDERNIVIRLHVLNPTRVFPMISEEDGAVWYKVSDDYLAGLFGPDLMIPSREIIHDRWNCLYHPLVGMSPIAACASAVTQGKAIQDNSSWFFINRSMPGGVLTAPGVINNETAVRLKAHWEENFGGRNVGKIAVLGDGLKFDPSPVINAVDAQLIEQLKWTSEAVCTAFHVPGYKVGVGQAPSYNNIQALSIEYYSQALQVLIESFETCLDEGLGLADRGPQVLGVELDLDNLLRMDLAALTTTLKESVTGGLRSPNEARAKLGLKPVKGGDSPMMQSQNYSLEALARRDEKPDPFASAVPPKPPAGEGEEPEGEEPEGEKPEGEEDAANDNAAEQMGIALRTLREGLNGR